jgi:D-alanine-D-alanine ligase
LKIAFTHNLQTNDSCEQAEFDSPETVSAITDAIENLGHQVELIEVSGPIGPTIDALERIRPDLVFNTAEGSGGKFREALLPAILDRLGLPFTGSDAYVCTVTSDKNLTKLIAQAHRVPILPSTLAFSMADLDQSELRLPVIVKPNFEGSSMGISQDSVADSQEALRDVVERALDQFPTGVLIEEFIDGRDIAVPFLEAASPESGGVLQAVDYVIQWPEGDHRKYKIYDFELKHSISDAVEVRVPAELNPLLADLIGKLSRTIYRCLGIRDLGRLDIRLSDAGQPYFLEANALPSLEPGAGIYAAAALAGLSTIEEVCDAIIQSALLRQSAQKTARA